jgi:hypothetical protein
MSDPNERRENRRHQIEVPVHFDRGIGLSRDISLTGIYFTTSELLAAGEPLKLSFKLDYAIPGKSLHLDCQGQILRVEELDTHYGIAAKIDAVTYLH